MPQPASPKLSSGANAVALTGKSPTRGSSIKRRDRSASATSTAAAMDAGNTDASSNILQDGVTGEDLYVHTASDVIQRLVTAYCAAFDSSFITRYLLSLLLEALVPGAPTFAKDQAQNQLALMSGAAGQREAVELVKFVQAAGRLTNEDLVANGERELSRINLEMDVQYSSAFDVPSYAGVDSVAAAVAEAREPPRGPEGDGSAQADLAATPSDLRRIPGTQGSVDVRVVPAASVHLQLQQQCSAQQQRLDAQDARIRELEATLSAHRPVFDSVAQQEALHAKPEAILQHGLKKGVVVKRGKGAVSFINGHEGGVATSTTDASNQAVASTSAPKTVRYDATKEEVIAAARALAADTRRSGRAAAGGGGYPSNAASPPPAHQQQAADVVAAPLHTATSGGALFPRAAVATPYMHVLDSSSSARVGAAASTSVRPYEYLADAPHLVHSAFDGRWQHQHAAVATTPQAHRPAAASPGAAAAGSPMTTPPPQQQQYGQYGTTLLDVLPPTMAHALTTEDVVRIISDKRPLSSQAAQSFSAWYQLEQEQRARMLLDLGESSLVSAIQQNGQLASRLSGAAHSLSLERRYTQLHRGPSATEYTSSPASKVHYNAAALYHRPAVAAAARSPHAAAAAVPSPLTSRGSLLHLDGSSVRH